MKSQQPDHFEQECRVLKYLQHQKWHVTDPEEQSV